MREVTQIFAIIAITYGVLGLVYRIHFMVSDHLERKRIERIMKG